MIWKKDVLFCDLHPVTYAISEKKEITKRHLQNFRSKETFSTEYSDDLLDNVVTDYHSDLIKRGKGIDLELQKNKVINIDLACQSLNKLVIKPGEVFSFWKTVGKTTKRKGYKHGRVIEKNNLKPGIGGGLCNLGNTVHLLVLHSPLDVTEIHTHSDALAPDHGERVPYSSGTSVSYNNIDFRFKNNTDQDFQFHMWVEDDHLHAELRSVHDIPYEYRLVEEDHHFAKEGEKYFRISKIYRETLDKETGEVIKKGLIRDNHSEVMFDYDLIPKELIR